MEVKTKERARPREERQERVDAQAERLPTHRNTRPRGNPAPDRQDLERSRERFESLLGR
jgi:hypothetical protein